MKYAAVIVDTRNSDADRAMHEHSKFLPDTWSIIHFPQYDCVTRQGYNAVLTSVEFWEQLEHLERVLIFQHDSRLLRTGIEEFLEHDYVGAPWSFQSHGGNGGLSLRSPKAMLEVINTLQYSEQLGNEDVYFCNAIRQLGLNLAPREVCQKFSVESIFQLGTLGTHAIERYFNENQISQILNQYK